MLTYSFIVHTSRLLYFWIVPLESSYVTIVSRVTRVTVLRGNTIEGTASRLQLRAAAPARTAVATNRWARKTGSVHNGPSHIILSDCERPDETCDGSRGGRRFSLPNCGIDWRAEERRCAAEAELHQETFHHRPRPRGGADQVRENSEHFQFRRWHKFRFWVEWIYRERLSHLHLARATVWEILIRYYDWRVPILTGPSWFPSWRTRYTTRTRYCWRWPSSSAPSPLWWAGRR